MKLRAVNMTSQAFMVALQGKGAANPNLPADAELIDIKFDLLNDQITVILRSDSFEEPSNACPTAELNTGNTKEAKTAPPPRVTSQPASSIKIEPAKKPQTQMSQYAAKMAEEFSPEQRRLLSFSSNGETVIVKPIQFLKAEWDDINETVKSLGGKWVKGDIVSYWAIPIQ